MKIVTFCGVQRSGKTTLIREIVGILNHQRDTSAIVVNERGEEEFGDEFVRSNDVHIEYIRGGWVGCTLAGSLTNMIKGIKRTVDPDYLFIEPFELVVTTEILTALAMGKRDVDYEIGPVFGLIDAPEFDYLWRERKQTLINHITGSHRILITRIDLVEKRKLEFIMEALKNRLGREDTLPVSVFENKGIEKVMVEMTWPDRQLEKITRSPRGRQRFYSEPLEA